MKWGEEWPAKHDLSALRLLGTVGEPLPETDKGRRAPLRQSDASLRNTMSFDLQSFLASLPTKPGIYRMLDKDGGILYVG